MNQSASSPRLTRGAHDPKAFAYNIVGLFSQIIPLIAYIGRTLNDTMCDHSDPAICDRCQKRLMTFGNLISGTASAVESWNPARRAVLNARLAIAAARRLVDVVELGHPVAWAMKGGSVLTSARRAINAAAELLEDPDLGAKNDAAAAARQCRELDLSTSRVARKHGLAQESYIIGHLLKAASKAAEAACHATETAWAQAGVTRQTELAQTTENIAGAAIGAALDAAALLDIDPGRAESMMVVATGVVAEFDRRARPADDAAEIALVESVPLNVAELSKDLGYTPSVPCEKSTSQKVTPRVSCDCGQSPCAVYTVDKAIGDALAADLPAGAVVLYGCEERTTVDGIGYPCVNLGEHVEHNTALGAAWWTPEPAALPAWLETPAEEDDIVNDFEESTIGDAADEAIAQLDRAEAILNAIAQEHRAVEAWTRRGEVGFKDEIEYRAKCCVVCRDANGQPVPAPCRTMVILDGYGEEV